MGEKTSEGGKKLLNRKVWYLSFLLHKKLCKNNKNSRKSIYLKVGKYWNFLGEVKIWKNFIVLAEKIFFSFFSIFKWIDFRKFLIFLHNFLCKRKLRYHTLRIKTFLPPSLVFYLIWHQSNTNSKKFQKSALMWHTYDRKKMVKN